MFVEEASTVAQTFKQIDGLYEQGFRVLNYVGKLQAEIKDYYKLRSRIKRRGMDLVNTLATPFVVLAFGSAFLAMLTWEMAKERISPHKEN